MTPISLHLSSKCVCCGEWLIAPERSTYVSEEQVSNYWICPKCGNEFETSTYLTPDVPLTPEVVDAFFRLCWLLENPCGLVFKSRMALPPVAATLGLS